MLKPLAEALYAQEVPFRIGTKLLHETALGQTGEDMGLEMRIRVGGMWHDFLSYTGGGDWIVSGAG